MAEQRIHIRPGGAGGPPVVEQLATHQAAVEAPVVHQVEQTREREVPDGFKRNRDRAR